MQRDLRTYLADVQQAIEDISLFTASKTFDEYVGDLRTRRAVEREFTILAEALAAVSRMSFELHTRVDHIRQIAGFRNIVVHDYHAIDDSYVWKIVQEFLPILKQQIDAWAAELDASAV